MTQKFFLFFGLLLSLAAPWVLVFYVVYIVVILDNLIVTISMYSISYREFIGKYFLLGISLDDEVVSTIYGNLYWETLIKAGAAGLGSAAIPAYFGYEYSIAHKTALEFSGIEKEGYPKSAEAQNSYYETFDRVQERQFIGTLRRLHSGEKPGLPPIKVQKTGTNIPAAPDTE